MKTLHNKSHSVKLNDYVQAVLDPDDRFYIELKDICEHKVTGSKLLYIDAINCINYAIITLDRCFKLDELEKIIKFTSSTDYKIFNRFYRIVKRESKKNEFLMYSVIFRNIYRISFEKNLSVEGIERIVDIFIENRKVLFEELGKKSRKNKLYSIYKIMKLLIKEKEDFYYS